MANGGYILVDCTGVNLLSQTSVTVSGLHAKSKKAFDSGKPIIAINCEYGEGVPMSPISVMAIVEDDTYVFTSSILQIRVASNDAVTITSLVNANANAKTTKKG